MNTRDMVWCPTCEVLWAAPRRCWMCGGLPHRVPAHLPTQLSAGDRIRSQAYAYAAEYSVREGLILDPV